LKLWVIRHAKSSWADVGAPDFERPLNRRGDADGIRMGNWLARQSDPAAWIWTSDAVRALATARYVATGFEAAKPQIIADHRLYHASAHTARDLLRETPGDIGSVALVAHNPGLTSLVNMLAGRPVIDNLPTFGLARFDVTGEWRHFDYGATDLEWLMAPKWEGTRRAP